MFFRGKRMGFAYAYFERSGVWDSDRKIGEYREQLVWRDASEREIMRNFVDREKEVMISCASDGVGAKQKERRER